MDLNEKTQHWSSVFESTLLAILFSIVCFFWSFFFLFSLSMMMELINLCDGQVHHGNTHIRLNGFHLKILINLHHTKLSLALFQDSSQPAKSDEA